MAAAAGRVRPAWHCPACRVPLGEAPAGAACPSCGRTYGDEGGIPRLFLSNVWDPGREDVTETIKAFYEETPFPNYDDTDSVWSLKEKAVRGVFARLLDEQVAPEAAVLEAGCGTGQLSNFLGIRRGRAVVGTDICLNSLRLGQEFKTRNRLDNVTFAQMNLFRPAFAPEAFDIVVSNGVLHHTSDPFLGFRTLAGLVRRGGCIVIGLYNRWGRLTTDVRRLLFRISARRFGFLDSRFRDRRLSDVRRATWFRDQYRNPHESKHTYGEVLGWFDRTGIEFLNAVPKASAFAPFALDESLFAKNPRGSRLDHALVQLRILFRGAKEGGFFVMIGRKP
jgi:SAM-dependent methyltransferase